MARLAKAALLATALGSIAAALAMFLTAAPAAAQSPVAVGSSNEVYYCFYGLPGGSDCDLADKDGTANSDQDRSKSVTNADDAASSHNHATISHSENAQGITRIRVTVNASASSTEGNGGGDNSGISAQGGGLAAYFFKIPAGAPDVPYTITSAVTAGNTDLGDDVLACATSVVTLLRSGGGSEFYSQEAAGNDSFAGCPDWSTSGSPTGMLSPGEYTFYADANDKAQAHIQAGEVTAHASASATITFGTPDNDSDGDALPDAWEEDGIDTNGDGTADLDLPAMGADPDHKDIFIELDHMAGHPIDQAIIDKVIVAFRDAPVSNPDGNDGIALHVDNGPGSIMNYTTGAPWGARSDQDVLPHQDVLGTDFILGEDWYYDWSQFEALRQTKLLAVRRPAFHYVIAAHSGPSQRFSGIARGIPAADFVMAMHENYCYPASPAEECDPNPEFTAATFMHELGHTLGLRHGGTENAAYKPNYLSVMNYNFGFGLQVHDGAGDVVPVLDYSRYELFLDENLLNEQQGFGIDSGPETAFRTIYRCGGPPVLATYGAKRAMEFTTQPVDWDCDGTYTPGLISADVSFDGAKTFLTGPIDWNKLVFSGGGIGGLAQPQGPADTVIDEPTPAELLENQQVLAHGPMPLPAPAAADSDPPETTITEAPKRKLSKTKARLAFSSNEPGSTFECRLTGKPAKKSLKQFGSCASPLKYKKLKRGKFKFEVRATDPAGNVDQSPAKTKFKRVP